jgi:hypothetical protein
MLLLFLPYHTEKWIEWFRQLGPTRRDAAPSLAGKRVIIDAQTDRYKENYLSGAAGDELPAGAEEVLRLVIEACSWGSRNGNPWPLAQYPQYARIRELGNAINGAGGIEAMQRAAAFVDARTRRVAGSMTLLNNMWDGIGGWLP